MSETELTPPSSWCQEAKDLFKPVRSLGVGGFGSVWLAKRKNSDSSDNNDEQMVAIKVVGHPHNQKISSFEQISEAGYFQREVSILQEISNPRIVQCLQVIEDARPDSSCAPYCMVLEYCRGPTVEQLLKYGGALGLCLAQEVSSQLIDVVSYLHGRAVIHRDIKPDNIIVRGARYSDEASWSDDLDAENAAKSMRWNIKLIDFGFARPLRPDDILDENMTKTKKEPRDEFFGRSSVDNQLDEKSMHKSFGLNLSNSGKNNLDSSTSSISRFRINGLSAVGNRNFAAPEIKKGIRIFKRRGGKKKEENEPLSECVSDYGMIVDAFSTGATIRFMCTGIPPQISVEEFMQEKNSAIRVLGRKLKKAIKKDDDRRKKVYRSNNDLPSEAVRLILGMTHWNEKKRTTVRSARSYEWVASSHSAQNMRHDPSEDSGGKLNFLNCAM